MLVISGYSILKKSTVENHFLREKQDLNRQTALSKCKERTESCFENHVLPFCDDSDFRTDPTDPDWIISKKKLEWIKCVKIDGQWICQKSYVGCLKMRFRVNITTGHLK